MKLARWYLSLLGIAVMIAGCSKDKINTHLKEPDSVAAERACIGHGGVKTFKKKGKKLTVTCKDRPKVNITPKTRK